MTVHEQIAEALQVHRLAGLRDGYWHCVCGERRSTVAAHQGHVADVLTPLVEAIATERAASELAQAADGIWSVAPGLPPQRHYWEVVDWLRARAAVLRSQSHTDKGDQA